MVLFPNSSIPNISHIQIFSFSSFLLLLLSLLFFFSSSPLLLLLPLVLFLPLVLSFQEHLRFFLFLLVLSQSQQEQYENNNITIILFFLSSFQLSFPLITPTSHHFSLSLSSHLFLKSKKQKTKITREK